MEAGHLFREMLFKLTQINIIIEMFTGQLNIWAIKYTSLLYIGDGVSLGCSKWLVIPCNDYLDAKIQACNVSKSIKTSTL